jgi:DNA-binding SARP family transcriptional activator
MHATVLASRGLMEFRVLGPLEARGDDDRVIPLGGLRQRAVLAILLSHANELVSSDRLVAELWPEVPPASATSVLQTYVSQLRKALGPGVIATRSSGYVAEIEESQLDLRRFERLLERGGVALAADRAAEAAAALRDALALWRGPALADFARELFAQPEIGRLEELRLVALERRIEADLACGRHGDLIGELEALVAAHPLRERLRWLLILALYRSGRQADALDAYQEARRVLVDELGIEPTPALQELERGILRQDPALAAPVPASEPVHPSARSILVLPEREASLDALLAVAMPLARQPERELLLARLVQAGGEIGHATGLLAERRLAVVAQGMPCRVAAFTSERPGDDAVTLAAEQDVDLLLLDAPQRLLEGGDIGDDLATILADAPCDVGVFVESPAGKADPGPVVVPFGGAEHDWSAVELAAWIARSHGVRLKLIGVTADRRRRRRDASRLLARASLMVQQVAGVVAEPLLVAPGAAGVLEAARDAGLLVLGLSARWREEGLGTVRLTVAQQTPVAIVFVRRGLRPGGLAPRQSMSQFTWTLAAEGSGD